MEEYVITITDSDNETSKIKSFAETIEELSIAIWLRSKWISFLDILKQVFIIFSKSNLPSVICIFSVLVYVLLEEVIKVVRSGLTYPLSIIRAASKNSLAITTSTLPGLGY